jgi:hypothetical protein
MRNRKLLKKGMSVLAAVVIAASNIPHLVYATENEASVENTENAAETEVVPGNEDNILKSEAEAAVVDSETTETNEENNQEIKNSDNEPESTEAVKSTETEKSTETVKNAETEESTETVKSAETEESTETVKSAETEESQDATKNAETKNDVVDENGNSIDNAETVEKQSAENTETNEIANVSNYNGIQIDSDFSDWDGVTKTEVNNDYITESAMVYEGDYVYIYMHSTVPHAADLDGLNYDILTDLGQHNMFKLVYDQGSGTYQITGIDGAEIQHSDLTWGNDAGYSYEISIPVSSLEKVNQSLSFGIYLDDTFNEVLTGVGMTETGNGTIVTEPDYSAIRFDDGSYSDWDYIPMTTIEYATDYTQEKVADGYSAIYSNGDVAYGYVKTVMPQHLNVQDVTQNVTIAVNRDSSLDDWNSGANSIQFKYIAVDQNGNMTTVNTEALPNGTYTYYLVDISAGIGGYATFEDFVNSGAQWKDYCYGEARIDVTDSIAQMEYSLDMEKLAARFDLDANDIMTVSAQYGRIGPQWTQCAGTSSGPWGCVVLCCGVVAVCIFKKKKNNETWEGCFA